MEELLEQKKMHETSLNQRGGLLSVLLHQTTSNTPQNNSNNIQTNDIKLEPTMEVDIKSENQITAFVS